MRILLIHEGIDLHAVLPGYVSVDIFRKRVRTSGLLLMFCVVSEYKLYGKLKKVTDRNPLPFLIDLQLTVQKSTAYGSHYSASGFDFFRPRGLPVYSGFGLSLANFNSKPVTSSS